MSDDPNLLFQAPDASELETGGPESAGGFGLRSGAGGGVAPGQPFWEGPEQAAAVAAAAAAAGNLISGSAAGISEPTLPPSPSRSSNAGGGVEALKVGVHLTCTEVGGACSGPHEAFALFAPCSAFCQGLPSAV
jgi:hypothetical protein